MEIIHAPANCFLPGTCDRQCTQNMADFPFSPAIDLFPEQGQRGEEGGEGGGFKNRIGGALNSAYAPNKQA